jgi:hypothetical protein
MRRTGIRLAKHCQNSSGKEPFILSLESKYSYLQRSAFFWSQKAVNHLHAARSHHLIFKLPENFGDEVFLVPHQILDSRGGAGRVIGFQLSGKPNF